jgi:serine protease Do
MDTNNTENTYLPTLSEEPRKHDSTSMKTIGFMIVLSFLFGMGGAVFGVNFLTKPGAILAPAEIQTLNVDENSAVVDVVKKVSPAVVSIIISKDLNKIPGYSTSPFDLGPFGTPNLQEVGGGSGFIIRSDGLIVTNKHVVSDTTATYTVLMNDGRKYDAQVLARDPVNDIALVKISESKLPTVPLGDSTNLEIGQKVIAIGNSLGQYQNTVTTGVISGIGRSITAAGTSGSEQLEGVIQTDAAINPGNSGGPLLDIGGAVIGVNTAIDSEGQLVGFAIPVNDIKKDVESFEKTGKITKPLLGVRYVLVNQSIKEENQLNVDYGALIVSGGTPGNPAVMPGSAADKAGLREGDIILEINGTKIDQNNSLARLMKNFIPGDQIKMKILSREETKDLTLTLGESK